MDSKMYKELELTKEEKKLWVDVICNAIDQQRKLKKVINEIIKKLRDNKND